MYLYVSMYSCIVNAVLEQQYGEFNEATRRAQLEVVEGTSCGERSPFGWMKLVSLRARVGGLTVLSCATPET
jgi:hypothetical protein